MTGRLFLVLPALLAGALLLFAAQAHQATRQAAACRTTVETRAAQPRSLHPLPPPPSSWFAQAQQPELKVPNAGRFPLGDRHGATGSGEDPFPTLYRPLALDAARAISGVHLVWQPNPRNPLHGKSFRVMRWRSDGEQKTIAMVEGLEYHDTPPCPGGVYFYRVSAVVRREVLGEMTERESPGCGAKISLPMLVGWKILDFDGESYALERTPPGHPADPPVWVVPGEPIGKTGWFLDGAEILVTDVEETSTTPRFDALGRRVIIEGRPSVRSRTVLVRKRLARLRLVDPCDSTWPIEGLLDMPAESATEDS